MLIAATEWSYWQKLSQFWGDQFDVPFNIFTCSLFDDEKNNEEWTFLHVREINKLSSVGQVQKLEVYKIVALVYL